MVMSAGNAHSRAGLAPTGQLAADGGDLPRFAELLEAAPDGMVCVDRAGRIALVNAQTERLFGYRREELIGQSVDMLVPDAVRDIHSSHRAGYAADPRPRPMGAAMELAGRRRDGTTFPAEISLSAIGADDTFLVTAAVRDVSQQRLVADTNAQLASIIQSSHDAVIGKTIDQRITSWNSGAERLYGYTAQDAIGRHVEMLIPPEDREREAAAVAAVARGERVDQYETYRLRKDGVKVAVSLTLSPIADRTGTIVGVATVARDLTDRQRADARFRGLIEAAPDAMICVNGDGRIVLVNAQTERLFGYRRDELVGQQMEMLVPDDLRVLHQAHRARYLTDPRPRPMRADLQLSGRRRDGGVFSADVSLAAMDTDEGILVTAVIRDITERLELAAEAERLRNQAERDKIERQMHQSQRLESLGQLAGGVAHDFNNLLSVISNYAAFAGEEVAKEIPDERWQAVYDDIAQVRKAAERAAGLTHQLLAFARQEMIQPRVLNVNDVVLSVQQLLVRTLGEHVELIIDLADDLGLVLADPGQIEQILVNLAINSRDAMPHGGKLIIQTTNTTVDDTGGQGELRPGRYVAMKVGDTGTGIPRDVLDRVFEPFFTTKPKGEGTGLGLATVYGIITQAGGHVRIYSEPGLGTSLTALLPITDQAMAPTVELPAEPPHGNGQIVLVVEDESAMREVTRRILARSGYQVVTAASAHQALDILANDLEHVDLLLTDVIMPGMQGKELADQVRVSRPGTYVLFMSGYTQGLLSEQGILEPGVHLIEKPFSEFNLLAKLHEVLSTRW